MKCHTLKKVALITDTHESVDTLGTTGRDTGLNNPINE